MESLRALLTGSSKYEPLPRYAHISQSVNGKVIVQGGRTKDFSDKNSQRLASVVETFDPYTETWEQRQVEGAAPSPGTCLSASASVSDDVFTFGGLDGTSRFNTLHRLNTKTWRWCQLSPQNAEGAPMPKSGSGMISFNGSLGVFGGYGIPHGSEPGSFLKAKAIDGIGWTNEFHIYHLREGVWSYLPTTGEIPPPCANFTFTAIDDRRAVLFGGKNEERGRLNDVYIIDLHDMHWTQLKKLGRQPWPRRRSGHAACCLNYGLECPQLLVSGGLDRHEKPLADCWVLDVDLGNWRKVNANLKPRLSHSLTASSLGPGLTEVTVFGGTTEPWVGSDEKQPKLADTTLLQFRLIIGSGQCSWELLSVVDNSRRRSLETIVEKVQFTINCKLPAIENERDKAKMEKQEVEDERDRARVELLQVQEKASELQQMLIAAESERDRLRVQLEQEQTRTNELQQRLVECEQREQERLVIQEQAVAAEQRSPSWEVQQNELEVTDERLGIGGWAEVRVAKVKVAAKILHEQLIYDYHHRLFRREMDVAARVSHPNLLRFIGAQLHGRMAILTELMPTSLRAVITNDAEHFSLDHTLSIAIDVACALNYLHHMAPDPIIHRDLSSANVLLQPTPDGGWLAKVSDYGTVNFQSQLQTENPGSPVYTAPESHDPTLQTPKMDIYSFGVLLVEMCTCQFPVPEHRAELIGTIESPQIVSLIVECLNVDKDKRPTAVQLVDRLLSLK